MQLHHILAAADDSEEGHAAIQAAITLARRSHARVTVLTVAELVTGDGIVQSVLGALRARVDQELRGLSRPPKVDLAAAVGLPSVEIGRFAETNNADLIVVGRKHRSAMQRLLVGDTADAVARRSRVPCLFVLAGALGFDRVSVALDGSERGMAVLVAAVDFTRTLAARLRAITVEPAEPQDPGQPPVLTARSARLAQAIEELRLNASLGRGGWQAGPGGAENALAVRRGDVVEEIVRALDHGGADVLMVGYRRGGPAGVIEAGSVARRLVHEAPCAVLTIPL